MSKPTYATSTVFLAASGFRNAVMILRLAGLRDIRLPIRYDSVSPVSMMSSTTSTCRPLMSVVRSLRMRTTPDDWVPEPYEEMAIQSIRQWLLSARERSAITMTAPFRTPTRRISSPS